MIPSTPQIIAETRTGNIILEPMRMAKLKAFSDAVEHIVLARYVFWQDFYIKNFNVKKYT